MAAPIRKTDRVNFATPVAHLGEGPYEGAYLRVLRHRPFRQQLETLPDPGVTPGLELFLDPAVADLFAWLDGDLTFQPAGEGVPADRLVVQTDAGLTGPSDARGTLSSLKMLEGSPAYAVYEHVDRAEVSTILQALVRAHYDAAKAQPRRELWHPLMLQITDEKVREGRKERRLNVKEALDKAPPASGGGAGGGGTPDGGTGSPPDGGTGTPDGGTGSPPDGGTGSPPDGGTGSPPDGGTGSPPDGGTPPADPVAEKIKGWITAFLSGAGALSKLPVRAGEKIGRAARYEAADSLPDATAAPWLGKPEEAGRARRLAFRAWNRYRADLNPSYWLHIFLQQQLPPKSGAVVWSLTDVLSDDGTALEHPLAAACPELKAAAVPAPRAKVGGQTFIPLGDLADPHGYPRESTEPANLSRLIWHNTDRGGFVYEKRPGQTFTLASLPGTAYQNAARKLWTDHGAAISRICDALQVPCELLVATVVSESEVLNFRALRLEPLASAAKESQDTRKKMKPHPDLALKYDRATGAHGLITGGTPVPGGTEVTFTVDVPDDDPVKKLRGVQMRLGSVLCTVSSAKDPEHLNSARVVIPDETGKGGFAAGGTHEAGKTLFYRALAVGAGAPDRAAAPSSQPGRYGTFRKLEVKAAANALDGDTTFTLLAGGAATPLTVTLKKGETSAVSDAALACPAGPGEALLLQVAAGGKAGALSEVKWSFVHSFGWKPATKLSGGMAVNTAQLQDRTRFYEPTGVSTGVPAAADAQKTVPQAGTVRMLAVVARDNALPAGTTVRVFKNGAPTDLAVTLGEKKETGIDTTHAVPVADTDKISVQVVTSKSPNPNIGVTTLRFSLLVDTGAYDAWAIKGHSMTVPPAAVWKAGDRVRPEAELTWSELFQVIQITEGLRASPGLTQTLISTAEMEANNVLSNLPEDLFTALGMVPPPPKTRLLEYLRGSVETDGKMTDGWLLDPRQALLAGAAKIRRSYLKGSQFDLPLVNSAYNKGEPTRERGAPWGLVLHDDTYPRKGAYALNEVVGIFDASPPPAAAPSVRHLK